MAGQGVNRRKAIQVMGIAALAMRFPGFQKWKLGDAKHSAHHSKDPNYQRKPSQIYQPVFFTVQEFQLVTILSELILPADDTPGATEAGVNEFIDFITFYNVDLQPKMRAGLQSLNEQAVLFQKRFIDLSAQQQDLILKSLAYDESAEKSKKRAKDFFATFRKYTVMGYYTSEVGMKALDCPSLNTYYPDSPQCPHPTDPEHKNLPKGHV